MKKNAATKEKESEIDKKLKKLIPLFAFLGVLIIVFIASYYFFHNLGKINYEGITFRKEMFGSIPLYHASLIAESAAGQKARYELYFRIDPRENKVPVEGKIYYPAGKYVYTSLNATGLKCNYTMVALSELSQFLAGNFINVKAGVLDYNDSVSQNLTHVTCEKYAKNSVIVIESGNETKVTNKAEEIENKTNCYHIIAGDCDGLIPAVEKFIMQSITDARSSE